MTKPKRNPSKRYAAKLTGRAAEVRALHGDGVAMGEIARRLGVSRSAIRAVVEGRTHRQ